MLKTYMPFYIISRANNTESDIVINNKIYGCKCLNICFLPRVFVFIFVFSWEKSSFINIGQKILTAVLYNLPIIHNFPVIAENQSITNLVFS